MFVLPQVTEIDSGSKLRKNQCNTGSGSTNFCTTGTG